MANIRTCNKHNMIACVEKTEHNADFHQIVDYLTGCSINYSLLVDPDLIGPWLQQFWATASLRSINEVPHIRAMVAGKRVLISEETIRADLLFDDMNIGVDCFPKQVIWDLLRDIGYEGRNKVQVPYSRAQVLQGCSRHSKLKVLAHSQRTASVQGTASFHGTATTQDSMQFNVRYLTRTAAIKEVKRLKRQTLSQAKQIIKLKAKLKKLSKFVQPVVQHHAFWVENQNLKKQKRRRKKHKKKVSSVKLGRNKDEGTLKSDGLKEVNIEEKEASNVKSGETEELDLETTQSTARQVAEVLVAISRPRGLSIPGPIQSQSQPQQPSQATDPKDKGKGILVEEPKRRIKLFNNQALETYRIMERFLEKFKLNGNARRKKEKSFEEE
ncbi:hypothetical protein Tco_0810850 [Tanacetum coccineum]